MIHELFPILSTPDIQRSLRFYEDQLAGEVEYRFPDEGRPAFVALSIGGSRLGIAADPDASTGRDGQRLALWIYVESCDAVFERLQEGGATVIEGPADQPWGERVARVAAPDGNEVIIGEEGVTRPSRAGQRGA